MDRSPPGSSVHQFSRREHWGGLTFPPPGGLPDLEIEPTGVSCVSRVGRWMRRHQRHLGSPREWVELQILGMAELTQGAGVGEG